MELISDAIDQTKPSGPKWHQELLRQMAAEVPSVRPAVLSVKTRNQLDKYRGFHHVVRNVYTFQLDPDQIALLVKQLQPTLDTLTEELTDFAVFLQQVNTD